MWQPVQMNRPLLAAVVTLMCVAVIACAAPPDDNDNAAIRIAASADAESSLVAHTMVALLDDEGISADIVTFADSRDALQALMLGEVDVRVGYSGESWLESLARPNPTGDPYESFLAVRDYDERRGIIWLRPRFVDGIDGPPANATFAFVVQGPPGADADLATMSQLASRLSAQPDAVVCVDQEFASRADGLAAVLAAYSVRADRPFLAATPEEAVLGVAAGDCIAGLTTATDGLAWGRGLRPVEDDLGVFPAFVIAPQLRAAILDEHPEARSALSPIATRMTTTMLGRWNARVVAGESLETVAGDAAAELRAARPILELG